MTVLDWLECTLAGYTTEAAEKDVEYARVVMAPQEAAALASVIRGYNKGLDLRAVLEQPVTWNPAE